MIRKFSKRLDEWMFSEGDGIFIGTCKLLLVAILFAAIIVTPTVVPFMVMHARDPQILLDKTDWSCTRSHTAIVPVLVGKITVPTEEEICDQYSHN